VHLSVNDVERAFRELQVADSFPSIQPAPYPEDDCHDDANDADDEGDEAKTVARPHIDPASAPETSRKKWARNTKHTGDIKAKIERRISRQRAYETRAYGTRASRTRHEPRRQAANEASSSSSASGATRVRSDAPAWEERKYERRVRAHLTKRGPYPRSTARELYRRFETWLAVWNHLRDEYEAEQEAQRRKFASFLPNLKRR
jgi:hypothetical protein